MFSDLSPSFTLYFIPYLVVFVFMFLSSIWSLMAYYSLYKNYARLDKKVKVIAFVSFSVFVIGIINLMLLSQIQSLTGVYLDFPGLSLLPSYGEWGRLYNALILLVIAWLLSLIANKHRKKSHNRKLSYLWLLATILSIALIPSGYYIGLILAAFSSYYFFQASSVDPRKSAYLLSAIFILSAIYFTLSPMKSITLCNNRFGTSISYSCELASDSTLLSRNTISVGVLFSLGVYYVYRARTEK